MPAELCDPRSIGGRPPAISVKEADPHPLLADAIDFYWLTSWTIPAGLAVPARVIPSACTCLLLSPDSPRWGRVTGARHEVFHTELRGSGTTIGVRFTSGGFSAFFKGAAVAMTDGAVPVADAFGATWETLLLALAGSRDIAAIARTLDEFFLRRRLVDLPDLRTIRGFIQTLAMSPAGERLSDVVASLGVSERSLQRLFERHVGISPKVLSRTWRFQRALAAIQAQGYGRWSSQRHVYGYYDQAHFINEVKVFSGLTPTELPAFR